jgi:2-dehydro-3-deoxyphosphogluconate aldolase / (4S)-4-hydroxy-2-oxoglutarate aldolase
MSARPDISTADALMRVSPVIPVLVVPDVEAAPGLAQALTEGGLKVLEVTLRTPDALDVIRAMSRETPDAIVGAGTVLNADQLNRAVDAGARFIVSPGLTEGVARAAEAAGVPLLPGVASAGDIMRGLDLGLTRFKFFPAETSGGAPAIAALAGPFGDVRFCPTGGVSPANAGSYLGQKAVLCVGGGWVAPPAAVAARDWAAIANLAREAADLPRQLA